MKKRSRGRPKTVPDELIHVRIRLTPAEHERIRIAAARRGIGFNLFVRNASSLVAAKVMEIPPDEFLGRVDVDELQAPA